MSHQRCPTCGAPLEMHMELVAEQGPPPPTPEQSIESVVQEWLDEAREKTTEDPEGER